MKILCVHGIGGQDAMAASWEPGWQHAIADSIAQLNPGAPPPTLDYLTYDDLFEPYLARLSYSDFASALWKLAQGRFQAPRGFFDFSDQTRWYPGMVVVWVEQDQLRAQLRDSLSTKLAEFQPDVVCAHSLGSLIAYDTFSEKPSDLKDRTLITLGSQIGNPFVVGSVFGGRIAPLEEATYWYHLFNPNDHMFTASLDVGQFQTATNFTQVMTEFGADATWTNWLSQYTTEIAANHSAINTADPNDAYLSHPQTRDVVWQALAGKLAIRGLRTRAAVARTLTNRKTPDQRALLVGINNYPDESQRLEGCVNDVFLISSVLQECGFGAEDIRVVLDERATASGIRERLHWLLDGVDDNDVRFFYYSGHGAKLPIYGVEGRIDHVQSCLVPHDFNWTLGNAITDDDLVRLYSQLPYEAHFMMVLDCCYSGGLTRGNPRFRGLDPPDDIRHRMLRWDMKKQMWVQRDLPPLNRGLAERKNSTRFLGEDKATVRIGGGAVLRTQSPDEYNRTRTALKHKGPYMPVVYEACQEDEFSFEYQHGAISQGAFTYAMAAILRRSRGPLTFGALLKETGSVLSDLRYEQHPQVVGPREVLKANVPWHGGNASP